MDPVLLCDDDAVMYSVQFERWGTTRGSASAHARIAAGALARLTRAYAINRLDARRSGRGDTGEGPRPYARRSVDRRAEASSARFRITQG
jgi:hypothetical protein